MKPLAIVTGASSGIGQALCQLLCRDYFVVATGRDGERLGQTLNQVPLQYQSNIRLLQRDLLIDADRDELIGSAMKCFPAAGGLSLLIHSAGAGATGEFNDIPLTEYERLWRLNFLAPVALTQQALPYLRTAKNASVVFLTSGVSFRSLPGIAPYASAKAALNSFTEGLRAELADQGIHVMLFSPGPVATRFQENKTKWGAKRREFPTLTPFSAMQSAGQILHALRAKKERKVMGLEAQMGRILNGLSPRLTDLIVLRRYRLPTG